MGSISVWWIPKALYQNISITSMYFYIANACYYNIYLFNLPVDFLTKKYLYCFLLFTKITNLYSCTVYQLEIHDLNEFFFNMLGLV